MTAPAPEFEPVGLERVFARNPLDDTGVALEQAAQLVMLGVTMSGTSELLEVLRREGGPLGVIDDISPMPPPPFDDWQDLAELVASNTRAFVRPDSSPYLTPAVQREISRAMSSPDFIQREWMELNESRSSTHALAFLAMHLWSPVLVLRVGAATVLTRVRPNARFLQPILEKHATADDAQVSALAQQGLHNLMQRPELSEGEVHAELSGLPRSPAERSIAIHGTFAGFSQSDAWFSPTSSWSNHVREAVPCDLWSHTRPDPYTWEGRFWGSSRRKAAQSLHAWTSLHGISRVRVAYAHSHGGNVALDYLATGGGIDLLVLMHTPVIARRRQTWARIEANVGRVAVFRTKLDLVVWADRLASSADLRLPQLTAPDRVLGNTQIPAMGLTDGWFSHGYFTEVSTWRKYRVASLVGQQLRLVDAGK